MAYYNDTTIYGAIDCKWYLEGPSITRVCLVDTEMEVIGLKEITTEASDYYAPGSILSTPDGGCIISVMEYHAFGENYYHGKIIKLSREDFNPIPCSVEELPQEAIKVLAYPNPAKEKVTINGIEADEMQVYNALGQLVKTVRNSNEINVAGLAEGVYLVRIKDVEGRDFLEKVMVR